MPEKHMMIVSSLCVIGSVCVCLCVGVCVSVRGCVCACLWVCVREIVNPSPTPIPGASVIIKHNGQLGQLRE